MNPPSAAKMRSVSDPRKMTLFDYALMAVCVCLAIFCTAMSLNIGAGGMVYCVFVLAGTAVAYGISRLDVYHPILQYDGVLYALGGAAAIYLTGTLNSFLEYDVFVGPVYVAGVMIWMMIIGSFLTWRDGTLLFQTVPSLALFALVGCWDIYKPAPFLFFLYLLCFAVLMGRIHSRLMVRMAESSGYSQFSRLKEGVWRWAAGPEWAVGSGLAVIMLSLIGAPTLQQAVAPIVGHQKLTPTTIAPSPTPALFSPDRKDIRVGNGPRSLNDSPVFEVESEMPLYMRTETYYTYSGSGWKALGAAEAEPYIQAGVQELRHSHTFGYELFNMGGFGAEGIPVAGQVVSLPRNAVPRPSGGIRLQTALGPLEFRALEPEPTFLPTAASRRAEPSPSNSLSASPAVHDLVQEITKDAKTDFEKAQIIRTEIAKRVKYNLQAPPVPSGKDPVEYFLFTGKEGYCDLFATSMAVMAREAGIPSRYVVGFLPEPGNSQPSPVNSKRNHYVVQQKDAHAWAELLFEGVGWVVFDATDGAVSVVGGQRGATYQPDAFRWFKIGLGIAALIGIPIYVSRNLATWKKAKQTDHRAEIGRLYGSFERSLSRAVGHGRRLNETPTEYLALARPNLGKTYQEADRLNGRFESLLFGPTAIARDDIDQTRAAVRAFESAVRENRVQAKAQKR